MLFYKFISNYIPNFTFFEVFLNPSQPNSVPLMDPMPKRHQEVPAPIQQIHGDHPVLVVPPLALPDHGGDGDSVHALLPVQAAGEGLVAEQAALTAWEAGWRG